MPFMDTNKPTCCAGEKFSLPPGRKAKQNLLSRLRRIEVRCGALRHDRKDAYCDDVIHQISAAGSALDSVKSWC